MSNVPNLDAMTPEDLMAFWMRYQNCQKRRDAAELIGDTRKGYTVIARSLGAYAANKATAMKCRLSGDIRAAAVYETICDRIYEGIPADCRW